MVIRKKSINPDQVSQDGNPLQPKIASDSTHSTRSERLRERVPFLQQLSLRAKVALFAIVVSTFPLIGMGMIHAWSSRSIGEASLHNIPSQEKTDGVAQPFVLAYIGITLNAILVAGIAVFLTKGVIRPVLQTSSAVRKLGQGHLETRLAAQGNDELAVLAANINWMADQFQFRLQSSTEARQIQLLKQVNLHLAQAAQLDESLHFVVQAIRQVFQFDRVLIYRIDSPGVSTLVAESVEPEWIAMMDHASVELWLQSTIAQPQGTVEAIADIAEADLPKAYAQQLAALSIKASLSAPIVIRDQCLGILIAHQCQDPYVWQTTEIDAWAQLAVQIGLAWERTRYEARIAQLVNHQETMAQAQRHQQELLQAQLRELLQSFDRAASGDLTVRTTVTGGHKCQIGEVEASPVLVCNTIAQVFNATFEQLHKMAAEVNQAAEQLDTVATADETAIRQLSETASRQPEALAAVHSTVKDLVISLQSVATQAHQDSSDVQVVLDTTETQALKLKRTETNISRWKVLATRTIEQINQLSGHCRRITSMTALFDKLILQVNELALKASVEAVQVEGAAQSFGLATTQIAELSNRLRAAMQEVDQLLHNLQHEASRVIRGIEHEVFLISRSDLEEVPNQRVEQPPVSVGQIKQRMQSMVQTVETQTDTAQILLNSVEELASESKDVSNETAQVARSYQQLLIIVQQLQKSMQALKVKQSSG